MPNLEPDDSIPMSLHKGEIAKRDRRIQELEARLSNSAGSESMSDHEQTEQRTIDRVRRETVMAAAEDLKKQGITLFPLPDQRYSDLEGMNVSTLARHREQLHIGSISWLVRHARSGKIPSYLLRGERWFDALDIKDVQDYAADFKRLGYTRQRRKVPFPSASTR